MTLQSVSVAFGDLPVIRDLQLDIAAGEFIVLLGPSGCGKSTLLNAIAGLLDIAAGQIWIAGRNVTWKEPKDRGIGMVFQSYALYPRMTVEGNLSFGLKMAGVKRPEIERRITNATRLLHLEEFRHRRPAELSGGQRQRVAIGRALVRDVKVFLFDEPLSNLDAALRTELRVELKRLHRQLEGATMIYVTHDQIEALTLADRIAVMHDGVIQQLDVPRSIYLKPANRFVAGFVGSPAMNFLPGRFVISDGEPFFEGGGLRQPLAGYEFRGRPEPGRPCELGIRPEHVAVAAGGNGAAPVHPATIEMIEPMGADALVWTSIAGAPFTIRMDGDAPTTRGQKLSLLFPADRLGLFDAETGARL